MVLVGPLLGGGLSLLAGLVYAAVGRVVANRDLPPDHRSANQAFGLFWNTLAGLSVVGAGFGVAAAFGFRDLAVNLVLLHVALLVICLALWGLGYYLVYLFTGWKQARWWLAFFYTFFYLVLDYVVVLAEPDGVKAGRWQTELTYRNDYFQHDPFLQFLLLFLLVPQIVGSIGYFLLIFKVEDAMQRFRIGVVATTLLGWFLSSVLASVAGVAQDDWWMLTSRFISLGAAILIYIAYRPPRRLHARIQGDAATSEQPE